MNPGVWDFKITTIDGEMLESAESVLVTFDATASDGVSDTAGDTAGSGSSGGDVVVDNGDAAGPDTSTPETDEEGNGAITFPDKASATLEISWTAPSAKEDGEPIALSEIAGYKLLFREPHESTWSSIIIEDGTATSHEMVLQNTDWEFSVQALDYNDLESEMSEIVSYQR